MWSSVTTTFKQIENNVCTFNSFLALLLAGVFYQKHVYGLECFGQLWFKVFNT